MNQQIKPQTASAVSLQLRLDSTGATSTDVLTLSERLLPAHLVSTVLIDAITGKPYFCRILTTGVVQVYDMLATKPTALYGNIVYACV